MSDLKKPDMSTRQSEAMELDRQDAYYEPLFSNDNLQYELFHALNKNFNCIPLDSEMSFFLNSLWKQGFVVARMDSVRELINT